MDFNDNILEKIQQQFYEAFVSQDSELFDVTFEIEGKKLYADKLRLSIISSTFKSMLSDRWNLNKNKPIKIRNYKFENFKEFLTFIYSGKCILTNTSVLNMLDMAEFYQIPQFKHYCDEYLSKMEITLDNFHTFMEITNKHVLIKLKQALQNCISQNFQNFVQANSFLKADKSVIKMLATFEPDVIEPEDIFKAIYQWAEYQAINKQKESNEGNFNKDDAIKAEILEYLPYIQFKKMTKIFVNKFVVERGFLFSTNELICILDTVNSDKMVKVTNFYGQLLYGYLPNDVNGVKIIKSIKNNLSENLSNSALYWKTEPAIIISPRIIVKKCDIPWYLVYHHCGVIGVKHHSENTYDNSLLAEMIPGISEFEITPKCKIEIVE